MSGYKTFAVVGAGNMGKPIIDELLKLKSSGTISTVVVTSRSAESSDEWAAKGAKLIVVDYSSLSSLQAAFADIDVVICTLGIGGISLQPLVVDAAKAASVKLFVSSEFGLATNDNSDPIVQPKKDVEAQLRRIGLPFCSFYTGGFMDMVFYFPPLGYDALNGKVELTGDGSAPISFTARDDIARYLAHVLTALPRSKLEWRIFRIEGERISYKDLVVAHQTKTGKKLEVTSVPLSEIQEKYAKDPHDYVTFLRKTWQEGFGGVGIGNDNDEWPEWNPKKIFDIIS